MQCFVIQPFDNSVFDRRFEEVFDPAIKEAGLQPYRVDRDPSASIPIEAIERGIRNSIVCFAEITTDNPNVWFELGHAIALNKELCIVCGKERPRFPFDIQHRKVIQYDSGSPSDFARLKGEITGRLKAILEKASALETIQSEPIKDDSGLSQHEIITLACIVENMYGSEDRTAIGAIISDMERLGYNKLAANVGLRKLLSRGMISSKLEPGEYEPYFSYAVEDAGWNWITGNEHRLNFSAKPKPPKSGEFDRSELDDEIPF